MQTDAALELAILRAVDARGTAYGYERPAVEGYSREAIDAAVEHLHRGGFLEAWKFLSTAFGPSYPAHWEPSVLTDRGRQLLEQVGN